MLLLAFAAIVVVFAAANWVAMSTANGTTIGQDQDQDIKGTGHRKPDDFMRLAIARKAINFYHLPSPPSASLSIWMLGGPGKQQLARPLIGNGNGDGDGDEEGVLPENWALRNGKRL